MVVGAGQMGSGIAQVCAQANYQVVLHDIKDEFVQRGLSVIEKNLNRQVEKGRMSDEEKQQVLGIIIKSTDLKNAADVDLVIEAATENMEIKSKSFQNWMK